MAGVMLVTMALSMWINNTATTAMMIPIVDSILVELYTFDEQPKAEIIQVQVGNGRSSWDVHQVQVPNDQQALQNSSKFVSCFDLVSNVNIAFSIWFVEKIAQSSTFIDSLFG